MNCYTMQEKSNEGRKIIAWLSLSTCWVSKRMLPSNVVPRVSPSGYKVDFLAGQLTLFFLRSRERWLYVLLEVSVSEIEVGLTIRGRKSDLEWLTCWTQDWEVWLYTCFLGRVTVLFSWEKFSSFSLLASIKNKDWNKDRNNYCYLRKTNYRYFLLDDCNDAYLSLSVVLFPQQMVWSRERLQCISDRLIRTQLRRSFQFLLKKVHNENCAHVSWSGESYVKVAMEKF